MRISPRHLEKHSLTSAGYLLKFPMAVMVDSSVVKKISRSNQGQTRSTETRAKISAAIVKQHESDPTLRIRISEGTRAGMHQLDAWEKFCFATSIRDSASLAKNFQSNDPVTKAKMYTPERNAKVSVAKTQWWFDGRRGQTVEKLYGESTGRRIREIKSEQTQGEKNPAFGKVYDNVGRKVGRYKGKLFRSVWEYSFYRHLEEKLGVDLSHVEYEPLSLPYRIGKKNRTYHPDMLINSLSLLVEVKCEHELQKKRGSRIRAAKFDAAKKYCHEHGLQFKVMTEKDFKIQPYPVAYADPNIEWIRR